MGRVIRLYGDGNPAEGNASVWSRLLCRARVRLGKLLLMLHVPGVVHNVQIDDAVTGLTVEVEVGVLFTVVRVNGRDFWFDRFTGRFDGTGTAL